MDGELIVIKLKIILGSLFTIILLCLNGCLDEQIDKEKINSINDIVTFEELEINSEKYISKNVTIEGFINKSIGNNIGVSYIFICNDNSSNPTYCILLKITSNISIIQGYYRLNGIVGKHPETSLIMIDVISVELIQ